MSADGCGKATARISATTPWMPVRSAPPIWRGHSAIALYTVTFRPNVDGRIATVQLHWEDPDTHQVTEIAPIPSLAISIPGIWPRASRTLIPASNWPSWSPNTPRSYATASGLPKPTHLNWSSTPTGSHPSYGKTPKSPSSPAW
jgi:hypothetical protein